MIYPFVEVIKKAYPIRHSLDEKKPYLKNLLYFIVSLCEDFDHKCENIEVDDEKQIWLLYTETCIDCSQFMHQYKDIITHISTGLSIHGINEHQEPACLTFSENNHQCEVVYHSISGQMFTQLSCIHIEAQLDPMMIHFIHAFLEEYQLDIPFVAMDPSWQRQLNREDIFDDEDQYYYFDYIPLKQEPVDRVIEYLSLQKMTKLWELFLVEGLNAYEFSLSYQDIPQVTLFNLEISLRLALKSTQTMVTFENNNFQIWQNEKRIWLDYQTANETEKLFLKVLFPVKRRF